MCRGIKNPRKRSIRGDLNSGMWTVLRFTDSHEITQGGSPIITRHSTDELTMNKKLNRALKDDFQEQMKCHFCPSNRDKRISRHVRNREISNSPRQIAIFYVFRDRSRNFPFSATNRDFFSPPRKIAHFPLNLKTKFAHFPLNLRTKFAHFPLNLRTKFAYFP